jgi:hypothetical protein
MSNIMRELLNVASDGYLIRRRDVPSSEGTGAVWAQAVALAAPADQVRCNREDICR